MDNNFHIFPSETFIDLCLYQYGHEKCTPGHLLVRQRGITTFFTIFFEIKIMIRIYIKKRNFSMKLLFLLFVLLLTNRTINKRSLLKRSSLSHNIHLTFTPPFPIWLPHR